MNTETILAILALAVTVLLIKFGRSFAHITKSAVGGMSAGKNLMQIMKNNQFAIMIILAALGFAILIFAPRIAIILAAIVIAGFALKTLLNSPPESWVSQAIIVAILLLVAWGPAWQYLETKKDNFVKWLNSPNSTSSTSRTTTRPATTPPLQQLGMNGYLDNIPGYFPARTIAAGESIGPVNDYDNSCLMHAQAGGAGTLTIWTRPDFTSKPVRATQNARGVVIPGHEGAAYQYFYGAEGGEILLNLQRREGDRSC